MATHRVYLTQAGWRVTDGRSDHGPYESRETADRKAAEMDGAPGVEPASFASSEDPEENRQGELPLGPAQHRIAPEIAHGDRRDEMHMTGDDRSGVKVAHLAKPARPLPPQMVSETRGSTPDGTLGDVLVADDGPSVWEALEDAPRRQPSDEAGARQDARRRADAEGGVGPAAASDGEAGPAGR